MLMADVCLILFVFQYEQQAHKRLFDDKILSCNDIECKESIKERQH